MSQPKNSWSDWRPQNRAERLAIQRYLTRDKAQQWRQIQVDLMVSNVARLANQLGRQVAAGGRRRQPIEPLGGPRRGAATAALSGGSQRLTSAPRPTIVTSDDRLTEPYQTAIHEAGHVLQLLLHDAGTNLEYASVKADGGGETVYLTSGLDRVARIRVLVGGHAALIAYGFPARGGEGDFEMLGRLGLDAVEPSRFGGHEETWELAGWRAMAQADVRRHREFVDRLADQLFLSRPARVQRDRILELWGLHEDRFGN
jgi:hypothetical protein